MSKPAKWVAKAIREQRQFEAWLERREIVLARRIGASRNRMIESAAGMYSIDPTVSFTLIERAHAREVQGLLEAMARKVVPARAEVALNNIRSMKRVTNYEGYFARLIDEWIEEFALDTALGVAKTARDDIASLIERGINKGLGYREVGREIRKATGFTAYRALTIARTETHNAALYAQDIIAQQAEQDFGIALTKHWVATRDARTRDAHADMDVENGVRLNEDFIVGGVRMSRPGDPRGGAANVINCRCGMIQREVDNDIE